MGGKPLFALNIVCFPEEELSMDILSEIMNGGQSKAKEAGIPVLGGHTVKDNEIKYGMVVTGEVDRKSLTRNNTAKPGDSLFLTKPIGTGIISTAIKRNFASDHIIKEATEIMSTLNYYAANAMKKLRVNACTDITGYGLLGHLSEICKSSKVSAQINFDSIPFIDGVLELAEKNIIPGGTKRNLEYNSKYVSFLNNRSKTQKYMISDAQTSGGLLISVDQNNKNKLIVELKKENVLSATCIGKIVKKEKKYITIN